MKKSGIAPLFSFGIHTAIDPPQWHPYLIIIGVGVGAGVGVISGRREMLGIHSVIRGVGVGGLRVTIGGMEVDGTGVSGSGVCSGGGAAGRWWRRPG